MLALDGGVLEEVDFVIGTELVTGIMREVLIGVMAEIATELEAIEALHSLTQW